MRRKRKLPEDPAWAVAVGMMQTNDPVERVRIMHRAAAAAGDSSAQLLLVFEIVTGFMNLVAYLANSVPGAKEALSAIDPNGTPESWGW